MLQYKEIPTKHNWKRDSSVSSIRVTRRSDPVLLRIDGLLGALEKTKDAGERMYLLFEVFFATNYWLKNLKLSSKLGKMHPSREEAIRALFRCVAHDFSKRLGCGVQALPNELEIYFGKSLSDHGIEMDAGKQDDIYLKRAALEKFKLRFKDGKAYMIPWRESLRDPNVKPEPADSRIINKQMSASHVAKGNGGLMWGWGCFVMSMSRDLYMAPHVDSTLGGVTPVYHSSYLAGLPCLCGGSIMIDKGKITGIRNDSGHYQPTEEHILSVVEYLKMVGVNLKKITIYNYEGKDLGDAKDFLKKRGNIKNIEKRMKENKGKLDYDKFKDKHFG